MDPSTFAGVEATGGVNDPILSRIRPLRSKYLKSVHFAQRGGISTGLRQEAIIATLRNNLGRWPYTLERD